MADKIVTLAEVVKRIAVLSDVDEETAREFMQAFCTTLTDGLINGESIDIKSIGRFVEDENRPGEIKYEASLPLASVVNRPFSCFDPVELEDEADSIEDSGNREGKTTDIELPELPELPEMSEHATDNTEEAQDNSGMEIEPDSAQSSALDIPQEPIKDQTEEGESATICESSDTVTDEITAPEIGPAKVQIDDTKPLQVEIVGDKKRHGKHVLSGWIFSLGLVIGICLGFVGGIFSYEAIFGDPRPEIPVVDSIITEDDVETLRDELLQIKEHSALVAPQDSMIEDSVNTILNSDNKSNAILLPAEEGDTAPVISNNKVVIDTIAPGRFLATMARKHYGSYLFWVYIYEENKDKIADPDNVVVGTVVTIPDASKYGIDAKSEESIARARKKATEIANGKRMSRKS